MIAVRQVIDTRLALAAIGLKADRQICERIRCGCLCLRRGKCAQAKPFFQLFPARRHDRPVSIPRRERAQVAAASLLPVWLSGRVRHCETPPIAFDAWQQTLQGT